MACLYPNKGYIIGTWPESGKPRYFIASRESAYIENVNGQWYARPAGSAPRSGKIITQSTLLPCGKCINCRLKQSRDWANRMVCEAKYHDENYFVTLTYDDDHIEHLKRYVVDDETGEALPVLSLSKKDAQDWQKRLRINVDRRDGSKLRFYTAGEYGSETHRPHLHAIVFGLHLDDLEPLKKSKLGHQYYTSAFLEQSWQHGYVLVAPITWETCAYVARYVTKKLDGEFKDFYSIFGIEPEFSLKSLKPAIGGQYYEDHKDEIYRYDELIISTDHGGKTERPPQYYDRKYDAENPEIMEQIKKRRKKAAEMTEALKQANTTLTSEEQLENLRRLMRKRLSMLKRPDF